MSEVEKKPSRFNSLTRTGLMVFLAASLLWAGGEIISMVKFILPYVAAAGIVAMCVGLYMQYQKPKGD